MVHKRGGKEKKNKIRAEERKPPPSHTVFLQCEVIQRRDPLWRPPGLDLIRELQTRSSSLPPPPSLLLTPPLHQLSFFFSSSSLSIAFSLKTNCWNIQRREQRICLKAVRIYSEACFCVSSPEERVFLLNLRCSNGVSWRISTSERRSFQWKFMTPGGKFISQI